MDITDNSEQKTSFFSSGLFWGALAGLTLGIGIAISVNAVWAFPLYVLGSAAMGGVFGSSIESILGGDKEYKGRAMTRHFSGADLEQSGDYIGQLRQRENNIKSQLDRETGELMENLKKRPVPASSQSQSAHFRNMVSNQPVGQLHR